ncbi:MAG: LysR substrate-binding domain-containing protein, partial [Alphaproteobacteria bacterium]
MYATWLKAFHAVAAEHGFTAAGRRLRVGQPTVSAHVKALERRFGVELFARQGRSVEMTALGRALFTITRGMFGHEDEAIALLEAARSFEEGQLNLAAVSPSEIMKLAANFQKRYPKLRLSVSIGHAPDVLKSLEDFTADIAVIAAPVDDPRLHIMPFDRHPIVVVANEDHPFASRRPPVISLAEVAGERIIMREAISTTRQAIERACREKGIPIAISMEINSREAVMEAVARGLGIGFFAETEVQPHRQLRVIRVRDAEMYVYAFLVCLSERLARPLIAAFFDMAETLRAAEGAAWAFAGASNWAARVEEARKAQLAEAIADKSPVLNLGTALGVLAARGDLLAPSAGLGMALSLKDLMQHLLVLGGTGSGKTEGVLRPLCKQLGALQGVGLVVLD